MISEYRRPPEPRPFAWRSARTTLLTTARELCAFSLRTLPPGRRARNQIVRHLPLVAVALLAADMGAAGTVIVVERLGLGWPAAALIAAVPAAALVLALFRPLVAWWLSLAASLPYAVGTAVLGVAVRDDVPWPWTETGLIAHLAVTLLVACRVRPRVYVTQWALTLLLGGLLTVGPAPQSTTSVLPVFALLSGFGLVIITTVRGRSAALRQLRRQEALTEVERTRRTLLEERTRIARELHDVVAHHMSVVAVQAEAAPYRVTEPPPELSDSFASIRENALAALTELRHILGMLRAEELTPDGRYTPQPTLENVDELVANVRAAGLRIEPTVSGTPRPLPQALELSAFRIVQEALSNALRHSPGCRVDMELSYGRADFGIRVANSPAEEGVADRKGTGHGVLGMRERASALGGSLEVGPRKDGWFEVTASLPTGKQE
ncbi:sensor histidine kinase [Streptomyces sp. NPDC053427]|uniref:sensor histidine kinase n=1 Tax=Streptomyces sp. NPDC053427 TaxID=3365701 RepID=UPI0037D03CE7